MKQNKLSKTIQTFGGNTGSSRKINVNLQTETQNLGEARKSHLGTSGRARKVKQAN